MMRLLVVGGHTRSIGKTALVVDLIRAFPEAKWTAVKITQEAHGVCPINGASCACAPEEHAFGFDEECDRSDRSDTSRFLKAGASRALWLRVKQGRLAEALPLLRKRLAGTGNAVIESNTLLKFLRPGLYVVVLDPTQADFKASVRQFLNRADAFVVRSAFGGAPAPTASPAWIGVSRQLIESKACFQQPLGAELPAELLEFVRARFFAPISSTLTG